MEREQDNTIIGRILAGDTEAYREMIGRHGEQVFSLVAGIVRNSEDAEELTSDVFLKAFGQIHKFRGESKFSTWLYRIAYNTALSHVRKKRHTSVDMDESSIEAIDNDAEETILKEAALERLEEAIEMLNVAEKAVIELFYMQSMPIEDIAAVTEDTPGNVKIKLFRTRKKLASFIKSNVV